MCTAAVKQWFLRNDLQLNPVLVVGTLQQLQSDAVPASWTLGVFSVAQKIKSPRGFINDHLCFNAYANTTSAHA